MSLERQTLERHQVWLYLAAIVAGLGLGTAVPAVGPPFEALLWPALAVLLFATFTQVPLLRLHEALDDRRFLAALLLGNFALVPVLVFALLQLLPDDPALRLGVALVLLVPCTDWFITFAHLGGGDGKLAIAATPLNLLAQMALLPLFVWLLVGDVVADLAVVRPLLIAFASLILLPLVLAFLLERWAAGQPPRERRIERLGILPVPLLALVVFLIAAAQVGTLTGTLPALGPVLLVYVLYLLAAAVLGRLLARAFGLDTGAARTLVFSLGTRNSFVVLPLALALPAAWRVAVVVIVLQSLIELFGMMAYLRLVPGRLLPASSGRS